uniref:Uncharacterized protein n=1 Tax=Meloidogyne enterolobii TaxID=390850 RepID=A0A6V7XMH8_MELEN|nr:unnamed protein product [Meloidogyne enterolobii]
MNNIHLNVLDAIITNSDRMRNYLCNNNITKIKSILFELMLSPKLIMLENLHPEVLKIGKVIDTFQVDQIGRISGSLNF